uniref:Uncharacterized protein n=1 Tax=Chrysotila carterae TaxID=13221 RepID=A0A7S4BVQ8_CHRCT
MSDQADFLARVSEGTPQGESRAASGLVGTARTPSPRPNQKTGGKRSRETEKSPSEVAATSNKAPKNLQNWGSASTQQSDAFHPGTSSNKGKRKASPKKTRPTALPYQGFRIPQITNNSSNSKGKGIMKAKATAALKGECEPKQVRNSVRFMDVEDDEVEDDTNNDNDQAAEEEDSPPQAPDTEGGTHSFTSAKEFSSSSPPSTGEEQKNDTSTKFSITDEAKVSYLRRFSLLGRLLPKLVLLTLVTIRCDFRILEFDLEGAKAPSTSFASFGSKPNHRANCTKIEHAQSQTRFLIPLIEWNEKHFINDSCTSCYPQVFKISLAREDLPRQKYIDVPMVVNGIAVRLGVAPEAARDTRGFGTTGNPRNGTLYVVIPPHFWERLDKALSENAEGFDFLTLFPATCEVSDRSPVTMFAKRASEKAVMQPAQKGPKVKLPWISFQLSSAFMGLGSKACVATKVMLESLGFEIPSVPRIARDKRGNLMNMLHVEFSDYSESVTQVKWHKWSRYTRGMPVMCEGYTLHTTVRGFADGFRTEVLKAKIKCFHSLGKYCSCQERNTNQHQNASSSAKAVDSMVADELSAIQALYAKKQASSHEDTRVNAQGAE